MRIPAGSLALLMRLKPLLPERFWTRLREAYWAGFWSAEEAEETRVMGVAPLLPIAGSERALLAEAVGDTYPFTSLLELGCGFGQNFYTIAKQYRGLELVGIDINGDDVRQGTEQLRQAGLSYVTLLEADAARLERFADKSFDIVVGCGFMLYLSPENVEQVCREMLRVCRRRILLMEQHLERPPQGSDPALGIRTVDEKSGFAFWLRNYRELFERYVPADRVHLTKVPSPRWPVEQWMNLAHLISVEVH